MTLARHAAKLGKLTFSSRTYFRFLLDLLPNDGLLPSFSGVAKADPKKWMEELMAGYVTSADTGNEDLVIASRAALTDFCATSPESLDAVCEALARNLTTRKDQDRVVVPTMEMIAFLWNCEVFSRCEGVNYVGLCRQVQRVCYKTGNIRKIEAGIKVYGAVAVAVADGATERQDGVKEARKRLAALLFHPWPRVRTMVVDELWGVVSWEEGGGDEPAGKLKGVDWGRAEKGAIKNLVAELNLE